MLLTAKEVGFTRGTTHRQIVNSILEHPQVGAPLMGCVGRVSVHEAKFLIMENLSRCSRVSFAASGARSTDATEGEEETGDGRTAAVEAPDEKVALASVE